MRAGCVSLWVALLVLCLGCGTPTYTERTWATAAASFDPWIARANEPLRTELAAHRAAFDQRMTHLPTEPGARSSAIRAIYTEAMQLRTQYEARILQDLRAIARPALAASGLVGYWSGDNYRLSIRPDGRISYDRVRGMTLVSGEIVRVDLQQHPLLVVYQPGRPDRTFAIDHTPRLEGELRVIHIGGRRLRFWQ